MTADKSPPSLALAAVLNLPPSLDEVTLAGADSEGLELVRVADQLGSEPRHLIEGRVTVGRVQSGILAQASSADPLVPDPARWDLWAVWIPFTLHPLEGDRLLARLRLAVSLADTDSTAYDLFPSNVTGAVQTTVSFSLSPSLKIASGPEMSIGGFSRSRTTVTLVPEIDAFGVGERDFSWVHSPPADTDGVPVGTKHAIAVVQAPRVRDDLEMTITWSAELRHSFLGRQRTIQATGATIRTLTR